MCWSITNTLHLHLSNRVSQILVGRFVDLFLEMSFILCRGSLKPSTQKVLSLAAEFKTLEKDKEHLRVNLDRAEEEVRLLFEQNKTLDVENKRLLRQLQKERNCNGSGGKKSSSASAKVRGENGQRETWLQKTSHALPVCVYTYTFTASVIPEEQIKSFARLDR